MKITTKYLNEKKVCWEAQTGIQTGGQSVIEELNKTISFVETK